ncbi:phytanoyl-CoA dioxygenase family protein [Seonamhaeicola sediminis]|uniref:Ectoine hydroxylase-related dioxygenase (Phytanoyl-CoA dioxygenase family) n=2 Tax=Seonamhaeicola TaxID=1649495 RepID=A0A3D9HDZ2_9FLAO|nr:MULTISPECIES: phytanoyl-CoA dioxygenase family protein [Seonamhaeicola]RED47491.1 ectoine hydroxylase-related dioxygenase (phytanoyl-CoA dioxygenase family) [Seonamhaeicola aphaedonensis]TWO34662.1 phytanoyl-CoA dioxygenase family protein [Seonamhaeicola sediminis]
MKLPDEIQTSDLSEYSSPISDFIKQPQTPEDWQQYVLSEEQIKFYEENGFLSGIKVLTETQVDILNEELEKLQSVSDEERKLFYHYESNEAEDPTKVLFHAIGGWRVTPGFHDLWWSPAYRMAVYQLMGGDFKVFHDQLFCKPAKHGGVVAWHQDFSYWTFTKPMNHLTCWLGLDDANADNGCMYYVPGSHKWGLLPITGLTGDMDAVREVLNEDQKASFDNKFVNELPKGYCSFHHPLMMHGSYANLSERSRRAIVLNTMGTKTLSNVDDYERKEALQNFPPLGKTGDPLDDKCFPILFDSTKELGDMLQAIPMASV